MLMETITLTADDGKEITFFIEEQMRLGGKDYLLVSDSSEDDANAFIFKDISPENSPEAEYVPVEDESELEAAMKIFAEMLDEDTEIRMSGGAGTDPGKES